MLNNLDVQRELLITKISETLLKYPRGYRTIKISRELYMDINMMEIVQMGEYVKNFIKLVYGIEVPKFQFELGERDLVMIIDKKKRGRRKYDSSRD